jgi:hypothetical protein
MTSEKRRRIRMAGIVALTCATLVFAADVVIRGCQSAVRKYRITEFWRRCPLDKTGQEKAREFADQKVEVAGRVVGKTIRVSAIEAAT